MPLPLVPLAIATLAGGAFWASSRRKSPDKGTVTADRALIFETALNELKEPDKLRALAKTFRDEGLPAQADMLEKRARLRELPEDVKKARREAFRKGMNSQDPNGIRKLANAFERDGATGAAAELRKYAESLKAPVPQVVTAPAESAPQPASSPEPPVHETPNAQTENVQ